MIRLTKPTIVDYADKTLVPIGGGFDFNLLPSSRRFEELIYTVYKQKIENEEAWNYLFDDIYLTAATGDDGADCILYKNGKSRGVIQCKKYSSNIQKTDFIKEVLKFVLYTIADTNLMPDPSNFHYYFVVSKGFAKSAINLITSFSSQIILEPSLEKFANDIIEKYQATLGHLNFAAIKQELLHRLTTIKIERITPQDLDVELNKKYNLEVQSLFFNIKLVTDNSLLKDSVNTLLDSINSIPDKFSQINLTENEILKKFETASIQLLEWKDDFSNLNDSHIDRNETQKILDWVLKKLSKEKDPLLMVSGNPGFGKSVILKDTLRELQLKNIPAIGIKADRYYAESVDKLIESANLKYPLEKLIDVLLKKHDKIVVLIDQIDSLSSAVTSKRIYLDVYRQLIDGILSLTKDKPEFQKDKLRVIVSIREFDLTYDFEFKFFRKYEKVEIKKLSKQQVEFILKHLNLKLEFLSDQLVDLLGIPSYLEIFCRIYKEGKKLNRINSAVDLMNELWTQETATANFDNDSVKSILFLIADTIHSRSELSINVSELQHVNSRVLQHLRNRGILLGSLTQIQFFHQTFYDYVFARSFIEKGNSLIEYVLNENQSIYIRPTLKIMLAFYRQTQFKKYIKVVRQILFSKKYRFHIRLLVVHELGFLDDPLKEEVSIVVKRIVKKKSYFLPFLESSTGIKWFSILSKEKILDKLIFTRYSIKKIILKKISLFKNKKINITNPDSELYLGLWSSIVRKALKNNAATAIEYLWRLKRFENDSNNVLWVLLDLKKWKDHLALKVFEKYATDINDDWYYHLNIIEDAVDDNLEWCIIQLRMILENEPNLNDDQKSSMYEHHICNIFEKLSSNNIEEFFEFGIELLQRKISQRLQKINYDEYPITFILDPIYSSFNFSKDYADDVDSKLLQLLLIAVKQLSQSKSSIFKNFVEQYNSTRYITLQVILITGYLTDLNTYRDYSFKIIKEVLINDPEKSILNYYTKKLLSECFALFTENQKQEILDIILKLKSKHPEYYIQEINGKKIHYTYFGHLKFEYLSSLPTSEINKISTVKKLFQELQRKYQTPKNKLPGGPVIHRVGPPLEDRAYKYLDLKAWQNTMLKFNKDYKADYFGSYRGDMVQHSREFAKVVEKNPDYFYPLLEEILTDISVEDDYIVEGLSGLEKANFDPEKFVSLYKLAMQKISSEYGIMRVIWFTNYLHKHQLIDSEIFDFLSHNAINNPNPVKVLNGDTLIHETVNSVRGAAIAEIIKCYYKKEFSEKIFQTVLATADDPVLSVRISALNYMAYLMYLDKEKTLEVFLKYVSGDKEEEIYQYSINTAQYLARYRFESLISYFKSVLNCEKENENLSIIFAVAWLNNKPGSNELLQESLNKSNKTKAKMIDVAVKNYIKADDVTKQKCLQLFCMFLENDSKEIVQEYNGAFLHDMLPEHFEDYFVLLTKYHTSKVAKRDPHHYFDYLIKCSKQHPEKCIDLISRYNEYDKPNHFTGPYYDGSEPIKIVIGSLNGLYEAESKNMVYINKAINLFDEMLQSSIFRGSAFDVLNKI